MEILRLPELTLLNSSPLVYNMSALKELRLPKNTSSLSAMISVCTNLESLDVGVTTTIGQNLSNSYFKKLTYLIMRNTTSVVTPYSTTIFYSTSPLAQGTGKILVPRSLVASYKADSKWGAYSAIIEAIEDNVSICA